ncbi:MAG: DUF1446 domain-containing protein [Defluviitaleaceae bacterium]|nr:DUF1446 domain-containing protein [Defluviitaleaceae bacterium]
MEETKKEEFRILSTTAILGYGFPMSSFEEGMKRKPHLIAADGGSTDPGPYYLGSGKSFTDRDAVKRDLEIMIKAGVKNNIPVVVGTAGGSGGVPHLNWCYEIVEEIAKENDLHFNLALIYSELFKERIKCELVQDTMVSLKKGNLISSLTEEEIDATSRIVGQIGVEPFIRAFDKEGSNGVKPSVILAGRAYDPACFAALPIKMGYDIALSLHLGKILECAAICATPGSGSDCMFGYIGEDYFRVEPLSPARKCTTLSVAAHTLYEKTNPYILPGPGGHLDLHNCEFEQETENTVLVRGTKFVPSDPYTIKLEGAKLVGYRTVSIAGTRDPMMISKIDEIIEGVRDRVADNFAEMDALLSYNLNFKIYGRDGVMAELEPNPTTEGCHELGIIIDVTAPTQKEADTICAFARSTMLHYGYEGRRSTAGNLAFPYSPSDFQAGEVYAFSVYHLLKLEKYEPAGMFPIDIIQL